MFDDGLNYDFDRIRKALLAKSSIGALLFRDESEYIYVYNATPEQLLNMARSKGLNLDDFKLKK